MNFTREPIIETIITPRDSNRLAIRSSKGESQEEFVVDAVEVVSFGHALFFRSLEKPRPFLVPVGDYEVVEVKESRVVLKNAQFERTIKIGGGREGSFRKEEPEEQSFPASLEDEIAEESAPPSSEGGGEISQDRKRDRRRNRRRRGGHDDHREMKPRPEPHQPAPQPADAPREAVPIPTFTHLIPPPTTLISESIQKYKEQFPAEPPLPPKNAPDDGEPISRVMTPEPTPFTTMQQAPLTDWNHFLS